MLHTRKLCRIDVLQAVTLRTARILAGLLALAVAASQPAISAEATTPTFKVRLQLLDTGPADAAAIAKLDSYHKALSSRLRAIPGLSLVTPASTTATALNEAALKQGVGDIDYEVWVYLAADRKAIDVEADSNRQRVLRIGWATDPNMLPGMSTAVSVPLLRSLTSSLPRMPNDPERDMESLVERMRKDLFPRDPVRLNQWMNELSDPRRDASARLAVLGKLLDYGAPQGMRAGGTIQPSDELLNAATEFAMTAGDPAVRLRVWQSFGGLRLNTLTDPSVMAWPAMRALQGEKDLKVQLVLLTMMSFNSATPGVRAMLESVAFGDRPELVRKAAQRMLDGNAGWHEYFAATLRDPKMADADRLVLMSYMNWVAGINRRNVGAAALTLDEAGVRSLAAILNNSGVRELRTSALQLMFEAGEGKLVNGLFIDFLRSSADRAMDDREVRSWVLSDLTFSSRLGLPLRDDVRPAVEEISARDPDPELRQKAREALQVTGLR